MRIKVKTLKTLVFAGILAIGGIFAGGMISKKVSNRAAYGEAEKEYCCGDIVFGEGANSESAGSLSYNTATDLNKICKTTAEESAITTEDFTIVCGAKGYAKEHSGNTYYPLKLGSGSSTGDVTISFKNYTCSKAIVYAAKFKDSDKPTLKVQSSDDQSVTSATSFDAYAYEFTPSKTINICTTTKSNGRVYISKIVFKLSKSI